MDVYVAPRHVLLRTASPVAKSQAQSSFQSSEHQQEHGAWGMGTVNGMHDKGRDSFACLKRPGQTPWSNALVNVSLPLCPAGTGPGP